MKTKVYFIPLIIGIVLIALTITGCTKTETTGGSIIGNTYNPIIGGNWSAKAWYEFKVNSIKYIDTLTFTGNSGPPNIGKLIKVEYNINDPSDNKVKN